MWKEKLEIYDRLIATNSDFERNGKTMPYTSVNGHMFSKLNKAGETCIRLSKEQGAKFMEEYNTTLFRSYGAIMKGYVLVPVPDQLLKNLDVLSTYLNDSYKYVKSPIVHFA